MSPDIYIESKQLGYAVIWGFELACFYDGLLIFRNTIRHKDIVIYMEDFIYWIFCAFFVFEHLYEIGDGYIRWYIALGVGIGMILYKLTLSKWIVKIVSYISNKIKEIILKVIIFLMKPFYMLFSKLNKFIKYGKHRIKSAFRLFKKKLTLAVKMLKIALGKGKS